MKAPVGPIVKALISALIVSWNRVLRNNLDSWPCDIRIQIVFFVVGATVKSGKSVRLVGGVWSTGTQVRLPFGLVMPENHDHNLCKYHVYC